MEARLTAVVFPLLIVSLAFSQGGDKNVPQANSADSLSAAKAQSAPAKLKPQTTCPVMGGEIDKKNYVDYQGKRIYVCCPGCKAEVAKDPAKYIKKIEDAGESGESIPAEKVTGKALKPQTTCPVMGNPIDKSLYVDYKGKRIYVCCSSCLEALQKNPAKYLKNLEKSGQAAVVIPAQGGKAAASTSGQL